MNSEAREFFLSKSHPPPLTHSYCKSNGKERDRRLDFVQMGGSGWLTPWNRRPSHIVHPVSKKLPTPILLIRRTHQRSAFSFRRDHQSQRNGRRRDGIFRGTMDRSIWNFFLTK